MCSSKRSPTTVFLLLLCSLALLLGATLAHSEEWPEEAGQSGDVKYGGCVVYAKVAHPCNPVLEKCPCLLQAGPSVAVTVAKYDSGHFSAGIMPGIGYGLVLFPGRWYEAGLAGYGQLLVGGSTPNAATVSGLFSFAHYVRFGLGQTFTEQSAVAPGPAARATSYLFGLGSDLGASSSR